MLRVVGMDSASRQVSGKPERSTTSGSGMSRVGTYCPGSQPSLNGIRFRDWSLIGVTGARGDLIGNGITAHSLMGVTFPRLFG